MTGFFQNQIPLNEYFKIRNKDIIEILEIFIVLAKQINHIHAQNIVHKDINPDNILIDEQTNEIIILKSTISLDISKETPQAQPPVDQKKVQGDVAFISPEQTGRTLHSIDFRADFYSLGVVLYQVLTGILPFDLKDPLEIIHGHVAMVPIFPNKIKTTIPKVLSKITMKLLAKIPEGRYQSATGLITDLEICLQQLQTNGKINPFPIAENDVSPIFTIPERLYGRYQETQLLLDKFIRVQKNGVEALFFYGPPGIGKSFLINEIGPYLAMDNGFFISGKYDQYKSDIPYSAIIQAFNGLVRQLLTLSDNKLDIWKKKILEAVGSNGQLIIDVIPDLELIIGKQSKVESLSPAKAQNRFNFVFQNFFKALACKTNSLILFLDDLQSADSSSLELLDVIFSDTELSNLLFIGAYRDIEANDNFFLRIFLDKLLEKEIKSRFIDLEPVNDEYVGMLLEDLLSIDSDKNLEFINLIIEKTNGNPFFIKEFLISLYKKDFIRFIHLKEEKEERGWYIDVQAIRKAELPNNIVELLTERIQKLSLHTQNILKIAACIGGKFSFEILTKVYDKTDKNIVKNLKEAFDQGMIIEIKGGFRFIHDRIQEALYNLNNEEERSRIHYSIGKTLLSIIPENKLESKLFGIIHQLNLSKNLLSENEKNELITLNYKAGRKAKESTAYDSALLYFKNAIELLGDDCWQSQYNFTLHLHEKAAESAYLCGSFTEMAKFAQIVLNQSRSKLDKVNILEIKINALSAQNRLLEAIDTGRQALKMFGISIPEEPPSLEMLLEYNAKIQLTLTGKKTEDLLDLPENTNPNFIAITVIYSSLLSVVFWHSQSLGMFLILRVIDSSVTYGNNLKSTFTYANYGALLCMIGEIEKGYEFGKLALRLAAKRNKKEEEPKTQTTLLYFIWHWKDHARKTLLPLFSAYHAALEIGDIEFAAYSITGYCFHSLHVGKKLPEVAQLMTQYSQIIERLKQDSPLYFLKKINQTVVYLMGKDQYTNKLKGTIYNEDIMLPLHFNSRDNMNIYLVYYCNLFLNYMFQNYHEAFKNVCLAENVIVAASGTMGVAIFNLYDSLTRLALYTDSSLEQKKQILEKVGNNQIQMQHWAQFAPMNCLHKWALVEAEYCRVLGQEKQAIQYYNQAISLAKESEYLHEEAMANELTALFFFSNSKGEIAEPYLQEAYNLYEKWGAEAKLRQLEKKHHNFFKNNELLSECSPLSVGPDMPNIPPATLHLSELDFQLLTETLSEISNENDVENYLEIFSNTIMKCAGAEKVLLLLHQNDELSIGIDRQADREEINTFKPIRDDESIFPATVIKYVMRTKETVILENAVKKAPFSTDKYIQEKQVKSIICMPIMYQRNLSAILYLENNLNYGVFVSQHQKILHGLSGQIAIFLENELLRKQFLVESEKPAPLLSLSERLQHEYGLTPQEARISCLFKEGNTRSQICKDLNIVPKTLRCHLGKIYEKTLSFEDDFTGEGRIDKLSRLIIFLFKLTADF